MRSAKANRAVLLGKATMYLVIDRDSRLIVGFYLTLDPPSWSGAEQAILSIGCDWEALCKRLNVPYRASDHPAAGAQPNRFFADRGGDVVYYASNAICDGLTVQVTNAPALLSRRKSIVESGHRVVPVPMKQDAPGYEPPKNALKRRAKKYHRDGCYTLDELARVVLRSIIRHNRRELKGYRQSPEEILSGASVSPIAIWNRKVGERMGSVARLPIELMRRKMMPRDTAVVKNTGIHFRGLSYKFDAAEDAALKEWFARASFRSSFDVRVTYHPDSVDTIWAHDPEDDRKQYKLVLTTKSDNFAGYSFAELKYVMEVLRDKQLAADATNETHDVAASQDTKEMSKQPLAEARAAAKGMTPGTRRSNSDEYSKAEAAERRAAVNSADNGGVQYGSLGAATDRPAPAAATASEPAAEPEPPAAATTQATDRDEQPPASSATTDPALLGLF